MSEATITSSELEEAQQAGLSLLRVRDQLSDDDTYEECEASDIVTDLDNNNGSVPTLEEATPETILGHSLEGYWNASNFDKLDPAWGAIRSFFDAGESTFVIPDGSQKPPTIISNPEINGKPCLGFNDEAGLTCEAAAAGRQITYVCMLIQFGGWTNDRNIWQGFDSGTPYVIQTGTTPAIEGFDGIVSTAATLRVTPFDKSWFILEYLPGDTSDLIETILQVTNLKTGDTNEQSGIGGEPGEYTGCVLGYGGEGTTQQSAQFQLAALIMYSLPIPGDITEFPSAQRDLIKAYLTSEFGGMTLPLLYTDQQNGTENES